MSDLAIQRGFKDVILADAEKFSFITKVAENIAKNYGFSTAHFPILENINVYNRVLGESSDIINKEIYNFIDKGENHVALRPEFTAGIVRSIISNGLYDKLPLKFFSYGPVFRYERPQKGRQRQFYQINFEYFGNESYFAEAELILLVNNLLKEFNLQNDINLEINSLGTGESREKYRDALVGYLSKYKNDLSADSKIRLEKNPLRILDSKDKSDQEILVDAPILSNYLTKDDQEFFTSLLDILSANNIAYKVNDRLVRGLDYYTKTVFEFTTDKLGAQNAVFAGGRYDNLVANMGGKATPAIGFAGGVERLMELVSFDSKAATKLVIIAVSDEQRNYAFNLLSKARNKGIPTEAILSGGNLGKRMKKASKFNPEYVVVIGEDEVFNGELKLKNFSNGEEITIKAEKLGGFF